MYSRGMWPGIVVLLTGCLGRQQEPVAKVGDIDIIEAFVMDPIRPDVTAGYLTIDNLGDSADALLDASTPVAGAATLHGTPGGGGGMQHLAEFEVPAHGKASLAPGKTHLMLTGVHRKLAPGDTVPITVRFQRSGSVTVPFVVRTYASEKGERPLSPAGLAGIDVTESMPKPDLHLTATDGKPFALRRDTDGYLTLLFFGYTHCPDVCPLHMANIAAVLRKLPPSMTDSIKVVVVTTDPARDTPEVLRAWLDHFDRSFIGLTGSEQELFAAEETAGVMPSMPDRPDSTGSYTIGHASQVTAFTTDNMARAVYPSGTRQQDWAHDIPLLLSLGRKK